MQGRCSTAELQAQLGMNNLHLIVRENLGGDPTAGSPTVTL